MASQRKSTRSLHACNRVPAEQRASYAAIIDEILSTADLETISAKRIRNALQERVDYDLSGQKDAIKDLIMERFDKVQSETTTAAPEPAPTRNGANHDDDEPSPKKRKAGSAEDGSDLSDVADSPPPKKAKKKVKPEAEDDEAFARNLQAEINGEKRATRGGGATKKKPAAKQAKKPKKKSSSKISAADDSDLASGSEKPEKEKKGGFHKLMNLSEPLSAMLGQPALSRPQTVKQIWAYVKERDLQDPSDKRQIRCDDAMYAVFKQDKVHMFTMNKLLANHLYPAEEE